ncbi:MAG: bacterioferritin [Halobacteriovoraceae bacterium]|nr:bacterioferritin [Halobacteriovoraceae bacterium]|tara:strand:- start:2369 stop:2836 length:468 start_codon:yes stop_codon:yes gene_type:complete
MKGHPEIIDCLNQLLCNEITAGNQFIMHARMLDNWGVKKLGKLEYDASMDEMNHADEVMKRILFLEGVPNVQKIGRIQVGLSVKEVLEADLKCEHINFNDLKKFAAKAEEHQDYVSRDLFVSILKSEEEHIDWLENQLNLIDQIGMQNYIQSNME